MTFISHLIPLWHHPHAPQHSISWTLYILLVSCAMQISQLPLIVTACTIRYRHIWNCLWCLLFIDRCCQTGWCELAHPVSTTLEVNCRPKTCLASASASSLELLTGRPCTCQHLNKNLTLIYALSVHLAWTGLRLLQISSMTDISSTTAFESLWTDSQQCGQKMLDLGAQACCWSWFYPLCELTLRNFAFPRARSPPRLSIWKDTT